MDELSKKALGTIETTLDRLVSGDMKDEPGPDGLTYVQKLAFELFASGENTADLIAKARSPAVKAAFDGAAALNASKHALLDLAERCQKRGGYCRSDYKPGQVAFHFDLPYVLMPLDKKYGPHVYMPCNRDYAPLRELGKITGGSFWDYDDYPERAWHFRRDPREIEGAWLDPPNVLYLYGGADKIEYKSARAFMARYRDRLRRVLAEAVPGMGGLSLEPEW
jgi:hypothetical protein